MEILNSPKSKQSKCNLFADFILEKIGMDTNTIIEVSDCNKFVVINGITDSKDYLELTPLVKEFNKKYEKLLDSPITHTFDFIEYQPTVTPVNKISCKFYLTSENTKYHYSLLDLFRNDETKSYFYNEIKSDEYSVKDFLTAKSSFPHGYSHNQGRLLYYYGKLISYNLSGISLCVVLDMELSNQKNDDDSYLNLKCDMGLNPETLSSYIEDHFDFNYEKLRLELLKEDLSIEVLKPLEDHKCLKENFSLDPLI